jgi:nucleotide-binding universal stress UspA family protein
LIPTDFSVAAQYAIEAAVPFIKLTDTHIVLVHIVSKLSELSTATAQVRQEAAEAAKKHDVKVVGIVREGSLFTAIAQTVTELDANMVLMGTHGVIGMQKVFGSRALKVIVQANVPFIVVQNAPKRKNIERVVFPVNFKTENREKLVWAHFLAKLFNVKINILKTATPTIFGVVDKKLDKALKNNMIFIEKFLKSKNIEFEVETASGKKTFAEETVEYAENIDADLVIITTTKHLTWTDYLWGGPSEVNVIANKANVPIMCVNPRKTKVGGFSATGG